MRHYEAVIFDLDGTLLDTSEGIFRSVSYVIARSNLTPLREEIMRTFIGPPIQRSFARVYSLADEDAQKAAAMFRDRYKDHDLLLAKPYEGIIDAMNELRDAGIKTAVATYKRQDYAEKILCHFGFDKVTDAICGSDAEGKLTKRDIIENAIKNLGVTDKKRSVMVGDSDNDAIGAKEIGVDFIGVTYGFGFFCAQDVNEYDNTGVASSPRDLVGLII